MQIVKDHYIYSFSASNEPIVQINLNEIFTTKTVDCYGGVIKTEQDLRPHFPNICPNGATGPIYFNDIKKGDTLAIEILEINVDQQGVMMTRPGGGILGDLIEGHETRILPIQGDYALLADQVKIPLHKMIGVIGVAPEQGSISTIEPGQHGGNLDTKDITEGNILYLPAFHDGGLFALGDLHAAMGDGELNGSGIEISGEVVLRVNKKENVTLTSPVVETDQYTMIISSAQEINEAIREAMLIAIDLLRKKHNITFTDAYRIVSAVGDMKISQLVNPKVTVRLALPKSILQL